MKQRLQTVILFFCAVGAGIGAVECLIRIHVCILSESPSLFFGQTVIDENIERKDDFRNHALIENKAFTTTGRPPGFEYCVSGRISSQGLNHDEIPLVKPDGEKRILVLGDSFVEARQVRRERNFCALLEQRFSSERADRIRVINGGVSTYSPILEYLFLKKDLSRFKPDLVLVVFFANDVFDDLRYAMNARYDARGRPLSVAPDAPWLTFREDGGDRALQDRMEYISAAWSQRPRTSLIRRFYIAAWIDHLLALRSLRNRFPEPPRNDEFFILEDNPQLYPVREKGWAITTHHLRLIREECDILGAPMMIACAPMAAQVYGRSSRDHFFFRGAPNDTDRRNLRRICSELGVTYIDLFDALVRAGRGLYFPNDGHWTPKGHRTAASALYDELSRIVLASDDEKR